MRLFNCATCGKEVKRRERDVQKNKSGNFFCSSSCAAKLNNHLSPKRKKVEKVKKQVERKNKKSEL